jgi:hypothetical protein
MGIMANEYIAFVRWEMERGMGSAGMHWLWCKFSIWENVVKPHDGGKIAVIA